jgi:small ligand-binding sensory domain FIST
MPVEPMPAAVRCGAALSTQADMGAALAELCRKGLDQLSGSVDLAVVFVSHHYGPRFGRFAESLCKYLGTQNVIGCTGEAIVGGNREVEEGPAIALWLAQLPGVRIMPMHLEFDRKPDGGIFTGWPDRPSPSSDAPSAESAAMLVLGEPFSFPADSLLERLNEDEPGLPVIGGLASGATQPGVNRVLLGSQEFASGAVAVRLEGNIRLRSVVSQGCRPIGKRFVVTKAERNLIAGLGGKPPLEQFSAIFRELPTHEQALVERGLHVGIVVDEYREDYARGDFLVRNVIGADPETGSIAIGDYVRVGQTVQFHLRDAQSADEDLKELLATYKRSGGDPAGALLFTCNGRGVRFFDQPDHDASCLRSELGDVPTAGFFAQGEIGPIGGKNFLHGYTASAAIFERHPV